jgi:hypothetical protein
MRQIRQRLRMWRYRAWERRAVVFYHQDDLDTAPVKPPAPLVARFIRARFPAKDSMCSDD